MLLLDSQYLGIGSQQEIVALDFSEDIVYYPSNAYLLIELFEFEDQKNIFLNKVRR